ncbi:hypothetical protein ACFCZY_38665 [Streptomyces sp. NPDC056237]|uniref:hypothetical protein n=1 Tax=unclassified Streptomyces TaxID=2593676 RepID=UPI0035DBF9E5
MAYPVEPPVSAPGGAGGAAPRDLTLAAGADLGISRTTAPPGFTVPQTWRRPSDRAAR